MNGHLDLIDRRGQTAAHGLQQGFLAGPELEKGAALLFTRKRVKQGILRFAEKLAGKVILFGQSMRQLQVDAHQALPAKNIQGTLLGIREVKLQHTAIWTHLQSGLAERTVFKLNLRRVETQIIAQQQAQTGPPGNVAQTMALKMKALRTRLLISREQRKQARQAPWMRLDGCPPDMYIIGNERIGFQWSPEIEKNSKRYYTPVKQPQPKRRAQNRADSSGQGVTKDL